MGTKDAAGKKYFSDPKRFADVVNFCIFGGRQVVLSENLWEMDTTEIVMLDLIGAEKDQEERPNKKRKKLPREEYAVQKKRDLLKEAVIKHDGHYKYVLIGIENQTDIYYAMPARNLVYDSLHYLSDVHRIGRENEESGEIKACKDPGTYTSKFLKDDKLTPIVTIVVYWEQTNGSPAAASVNYFRKILWKKY